MGNKLYQSTSEGWVHFTPISSQRRTKHFRANPKWIHQSQIPKQWDKATIYAHGKVITVTRHSTIESQDTTLSNRTDHTFWKTWKCKYCLEGQAQEIKQAIQLGSAVVVSDGSFQSGAGAAAWTIEGSSAAHRIKGAGQTPGGDSDQSAYQSELFGIWGILFSLKFFYRGICNY